MHSRLGFLIAVSLLGVGCGLVEDQVCPGQSRDLYGHLSPTDLDDDCRCGHNSGDIQLCTFPLDTMKSLWPDEEYENLGEGPTLYDMGPAVDIRYGDLWEDRGASGQIITAVSVYSKLPGLIVELDLETRARRVVSGNYLDPSLGTTTVGEGPMFGEPNYAMRGADDMLYVYAISEEHSGEIFRVNPDTGDRERLWAHGLDSGFPQCMNGVPEDGGLSYTTPAPMQLQPEGEGFGLASDGGFYLTTIQNGFPGPGKSLIKIDAEGSSCEVVSMGIPEPGNEYPAEGIGTGWDFSGYALEVKEIQGRLLVNMSGTLLEIDPVTGDRSRLSEAYVPAGEMAWSEQHEMLYISGIKQPANPGVFFWDEENDEMWEQYSCLNADPLHPIAEDCVSGGSSFRGLTEQQGWITPSGDFAIYAQTGGEFIILELLTGNANWFSY